MKRILLTGCGSPAAQNFLQCLRMAGEEFYIVGCDMNRYHLEWGELDAAYEAPAGGTAEYLAFINALIKAEKIDFPHGQSDLDAAFFANHSSDLAAPTFYPKAETIRIAQNKFEMVRRWFDCSLRTDRPFLIHGEAALLSAIGRSALPLWMRATKGAGAQGSCRVMSAEQGAAWLRFWQGNKTNWEFMLEVYLPGREFAFSSLWYQGDLICSSARERLEFVFPQHAPSGVTSSPVVARTVHSDAVNDMATKAILALDAKPHGIFSVDLKEDAGGAPRPTEINAGRFFTTSRFLAEGGCNMPYLFVKLGFCKGKHSGVILAEDVKWPDRYNSIPAGLYWIRHIDCGAKLCKEEEFRGKKLEVEA